MLASCTSSATPAPIATGACATATFILANPAGLLCLDDSARILGRVVDLPPNAAPALPSLSPDHKQVLFALTAAPDPKTGFGTDIYAVNLDGTDLHPVIPHEAENVFYDTPRYDPSGTYLYFHRSAAIVKGGAYVGNESTIERLDLKTGERVRLLSDAADPSVSRDGKRIAFIHLKDGQNDNVWIADSDGTNAHVLLKDTFSYVQAPRFAPTSDTIVFCAAGHGAPKASDRYLPHDAHLGIPSEIFVVNGDGSGLRSVAQTGDDTFPAWSLDGSSLAFVSTGAFFRMTMKDHSIKTLASGDNFFFGDITWLK
ncbi:MAG: TolB family protein [Candidatus Limnocylindria bacterium]